MDVLAWMGSGILAGWLMGFAVKGRGYGLLGNLLIGLSGGIVGGWVFRALGLTDVHDSLAHVPTALAGGVLLVGAVRALDHATRQTSRLTGAPATTLVQDIEGQVKRLGEIEQRVFAQFLRRKPVAQDPIAQFERQETFGEHVADRVAAFGGSWTFIGVFLLAMVSWMYVNVRSSQPVDPYPFILLNLMLSCMAALQAPVIMMSQNRQSTRDRLDAQNDYQVNLKAEMEILSLHAKLDQAREQELRTVIALQHQQIAMLESLARPGLTD
jgi:uncharacterized membrane protein/uncharacterized membrane protein YeaQ/YmgE (transglycosylase-associated protein family)